MRPILEVIRNKTTFALDWLAKRRKIWFILVLATVLYLYQLGTESLAGDEFFSIRDAKTIFNSGLRVRPVYYLLLHVWMQFSTSDAWLRGLSVLFSLGGVILIYLLSRRLAGEITGLVSALIFTLSPHLIYNAQEVRMYMVSIFWGLAGGLLLTYALEKPTKGWLCSWIICRLLALLTYPLNLFLLLPDIVVIGWKFRNQRPILLKFATWLLLLALLWLPFAYSLYNATPIFMSEWIDIVDKPTLKDAAFFVRIFTIRWWQLETPTTVLAKLGKLYVWMYTLMLFGLLTITLWSKKRPARLWWAAAWWILPLGAIFFLSQGSKSLWVDRYILFTSPYMMIVLAAGFAQLWQNQRQRLVALIVALVYLVAAIGGLRYYYTVEERTNWRDAVALITAKEQPGDRVSVYAGWDGVSYYYHGNATIEEIPPEALSVKQKLDRPTVERALADLTPLESRLWLVYRHRADKERHPLVREVVKDKFDILQHKQFKDIDLFLIQSR